MNDLIIILLIIDNYYYKGLLGGDLIETLLPSGVRQGELHIYKLITSQAHNFGNLFAGHKTSS